MISLSHSSLQLFLFLLLVSNHVQHILSTTTSTSSTKDRANKTIENNVKGHGSGGYYWDQDEKCFPIYGCFKSKSLFGLHAYPSSEFNVHFKLSTRKNKLIPKDLFLNDPSGIKTSYFDVKKETKVIVHGFHGRCDESWIKKLIKELLEKGDFNVLCVDWREEAKGWNYLKAAANTQVVGKIISLFFEMIKTHFESISDRSHIIGFSLGAHVAGYAGSKISRLERITGLDPAGPAFEGTETDTRLDSSDALHVDIIHTNGQSLIKGGAGTMERLGDVDFYANGGEKQPDCPNALFSIVLNIFHLFDKEARQRFRCNHERSIIIFIESINSSCKLRAERCDSWSNYQKGKCHQKKNPLGNTVGYDSFKNPILDGQYYFATRSSTPPVCGRQLLVNISIGSTYSKETSRMRGQVKLIFEPKGKANESIIIKEGSFYAPGTVAQMIVLESTTFENVYIEYIKTGWFNFNYYLRVTTVEIINLESEKSSYWRIQSSSNVCSSSNIYRLVKV